MPQALPTPPGSGQGPRRPSSRWGTVAAALVGALVLVRARAVFVDFIVDDAAIPMRYARRLLAGQGLSWAEGPSPPVEGYSDLLWVLAIALMQGMGVEPARAVAALGLACGLGAIAAVAAAASPGRVVPGLAAAVLLAVAPPFAAWTRGGLEAPMLALLLGWAVVFGWRACEPEGRPRAAIAGGVMLGMAVLARPDAPLFVVAAVGVVVCLRGSRGWATAAVLGGIPLATWLLLELWRQWVYGEWLPNTALIKAASTPERRDAGLFEYVLPGLSHAPWVWLALGLGALGALGQVLSWGRGLWSRLPEASATRGLLAGATLRLEQEPWRSALLPWLPMCAWLGWVVWIGGDHFPAYRHLVPALVLAALTLLRLAEGLSPRWGALLALSLAGWSLARPGPTDHRLTRALDGKEKSWIEDAYDLGLALAAGAGTDQPSRPLVAVIPAGFLPLTDAEDRLAWLDMLGLNDHHIARAPAVAVHGPRALVGHDHGDADYILDAKPAVVVFSVQRPYTPQHGDSARLVADPRFQEFRPVLVATDPERKGEFAWVHAQSTAFGLRWEDGGLEIPPLLLSACAVDQPAWRSGAPEWIFSASDFRSCPVAVPLDGEGPGFELVARAHDGKASPPTVHGLRLPPGSWRVEVEATGPVGFQWRDSDSGLRLDGPVLELSSATRVDLELALSPGDRVRSARVVAAR